MTFLGYIVLVSGVLAAVGILIMDHHARMAKIKYTQGHNE